MGEDVTFESLRGGSGYGAGVCGLSGSRGREGSLLARSAAGFG